MSSTQAYLEFREELERVCIAAGRKPVEVELLPVSKGQSVARILELRLVPGFPRALGENYLNELELKHDLVPGAEWHFLGRLQSRKIEAIASFASCIHTISRLKELSALAHAPGGARFYLQANISGESQKNGFAPDEVGGAIAQVEALGLRPRCVGLMGMAAPLEEAGEVAVGRQFAALRALRDRWLPSGGLSMGMSDDFGIAVREGSTCVRVGSRIFGARAPVAKPI